MRNWFGAMAAICLMPTLSSSLWAQGCAMCRTALEASPEGKFLAGSFAHGILLMLFVPYTLFGLFAFIVYRAYRKKSKERQQQLPS